MQGVLGYILLHFPGLYGSEDIYSSCIVILLYVLDFLSLSAFRIFPLRLSFDSLGWDSLVTPFCPYMDVGIYTETLSISKQGLTKLLRQALNCQPLE